VAVDETCFPDDYPRPMAKNKSVETGLTTKPDAAVQLIEVLQRLTQEVETLNQQVGTLAEQSQVLTAAIDDVRQEMEISWPYYLQFLHLLTDQGIAAHAAAGSSGSEKLSDQQVLASWSSTKWGRNSSSI